MNILTMLLQLLLTAIGAIIAIWIMVPLILKHFPSAEQSVSAAHQAVDKLTEVGDVLMPQYGDTFRLIREIADAAVENTEQLIKIGQMEDRGQAQVEAIRYIEQVLLMEGFEEEFLITNKPIIEGAVRAAVQVMNAKRDNAASA